MEKQAVPQQADLRAGQAADLADADLAHGAETALVLRTGPSTASERGHLLELLKQAVFPIKTLFCGDAGFIGYLFWRGILDQGHSFLIRVVRRSPAEKPRHLV